MSLRTWLYGQLCTLSTVPPMRVYPKKGMRSSVEEHPFIVYKLGNDTNFDLAETADIHTQYFQIYIHDHSDGESADYMNIDAVITELKSKLNNGHSKQDGVINVKYLETSQDLNDETLGTIMKYVRFQAIAKG